MRIQIARSDYWSQHPNRQIMFPIQFGIKLLLAMVLLVAIAMVVRDPALVTGSFCDVHIQETERFPDGSFYVRLTTKMTPGKLATASGDLSHSFRRNHSYALLLWPKHSQMAFGGGPEFPKTYIPEENKRASIKVVAGQTYRLRPGESLLIYRLEDEHGDVVSSESLQYDLNPR